MKGELAQVKRELAGVRLENERLRRHIELLMTQVIDLGGVPHRLEQ